MENKIMTLKEILSEADFKDIWQYIIQEYADHDNDNSLAAYFEVFEKLKHIEPTKGDTKIRINYYEGHGWDVDGIDAEGRWAIEFRPWNEWLGMELDEATLSNLKLHEIAAHCLWEMTFIDYDEDTIQGELCGLKAIVAEYKAEMGVDEDA